MFNPRPKKQQLLSCKLEGCPYTGSPESMDIHKERHRHERLIPCEWCPYKGFRMGNLNAHHILEHAEAHSARLVRLVKEENAKNQARQHQQIVVATPRSKKQKKRSSCRLAGCSYTAFPEEMEIHKERHRRREKKLIPCDLCPHQGFRIGNLHAHMILLVVPLEVGRWARPMQEASAHSSGGTGTSTKQNTISLPDVEYVKI